uniref:Uncharacterized protein n=1 Tax=Anguilla anguilla TaxID=7936 RepID=A0A0E9U7L4_ANGAN
MNYRTMRNSTIISPHTHHNYNPRSRAKSGISTNTFLTTRSPTRPKSNHRANLINMTKLAPIALIYQLSAGVEQPLIITLGVISALVGG